MKKVLKIYIAIVLSIFLSVIFITPATLYADEPAPFFADIVVWPYNASGELTGSGIGAHTELRTNEWQEVSFDITANYYGIEITQIKIALGINNPGGFESSTFSFDDVYFGYVSNLAPNPSFESGSGGEPDGWYGALGGAAYIWDNTISKTGDYSAGIKDIEPDRSVEWETEDFIQFSSGEEYTVTVWVRIPPAKKSASASASAPQEEEEEKPKPTPINELPITNYDKNAQGLTTFFYNRLLSRAPEKEGLDFWVSQLQGGAITSAGLVSKIIFSEENQAKISGYNDEQFITFLYKALFARLPETDSFDIWLARMSAGMTREEVVRSFTDSAEFKDICDYFGI
jgi:hypothetical protein